MKKRTLRPHELAAVTQKTIVFAGLILVISVFMYNGIKAGNNTAGWKTGYMKMLHF